MQITRIVKLMVLAWVVALAFAEAGWGQTRSAPARSEILHYPDMILINGKIVTVDKNFSIQQATAIRDEKIFAVGPTSRIKGLAGPKTKVIDLKGRTVIPGLVDAHVHFLRAGFRWQQELRLDKARSVKETLSLIEKRVGEIRPGDWIITFGGWDYSQLEEKRAPTRAELDRVAPNNPVMLRILLPHPSTHFAVLNSAGLKAVGITRETETPAGGVIEKEADGEPTGVLRRAGVDMVFPKLPRPTFQDKVEGLKLVMRDFHAAGLTSVIEMVGAGVVDDDYKVLFELWRRKELTIRTALHIYTHKLDDAVRWMNHLPIGFGDEWLKVNGFGEQLLAVAQDNIAPTFTISSATLEEYQRLVTEAAKNRWSIQQHTTLGTTAKTFLDIYEAVDRQHAIRDLRWSMAHIEMISETDLQRMKRLGMGASIQSRQVIQSELMKQAWGEAAASGPPLKKMVEMGLPVGVGTDATVVTPYHPFTTLWWMVTGKDWAGRVVRPHERLSRQEALRVHTVGSAWFSFDEKIKGSIEPGKLADLVVLSDDYLTVPEDRIRDITAVMTIVGGRMVYNSGR